MQRDALQIEAIYEYLSAIPCIEGPAQPSNLPRRTFYKVRGFSLPDCKTRNHSLLPVTV